MIELQTLRHLLAKKGLNFCPNLCPTGMRFCAQFSGFSGFFTDPRGESEILNRFFAFFKVFSIFSSSFHLCLYHFDFFFFIFLIFPFSFLFTTHSTLFPPFLLSYLSLISTLFSPSSSPPLNFLSQKKKRKKISKS